MKTAILSVIGVICIMLTSCGDKDPKIPNDELKGVLEDYFKAQENKITIEKVRSKKASKGVENYDWHAKVVSSGEYWIKVNKQEFAMEYDLQEMIVEQSEAKKSNPERLSKTRHKFPEIPNNAFKKAEKRESKIEMEGVVQGEFLNEKWSLKQHSVDEESSERFRELLRGTEKDKLPKGAFIVGSKEAKKFVKEFREKTKSEISRVDKVIKQAQKSDQSQKNDELKRRVDIAKLAEDQKVVHLRYSSSNNSSEENIPVELKFTNFERIPEEFSQESMKMNTRVLLGTYEGKAIFNEHESSFSGQVYLEKNKVSIWSTKINKDAGREIKVRFEFDGETVGIKSPFRFIEFK